MSDGLSTAVFVLGAKKGMALINKLGLDAVLVDADRKVQVTKNINFLFIFCKKSLSVFYKTLCYSDHDLVYLDQY